MNDTKTHTKQGKVRATRGEQQLKEALKLNGKPPMLQAGLVDSRYF